MIMGGAKKAAPPKEELPSLGKPSGGELPSLGGLPSIGGGRKPFGGLGGIHNRLGAFDVDEAQLR